MNIWISHYNVYMLTLSNIKALYEKYQVSASKRFGQNFLIDENVLKHIMKIANIKNKDVIEIGPGLGSLTHFLLDEAKTVTAYELDEDMIQVLKGEINNDNFFLIEGDFLKAKLDWKDKRNVIANIPYYITSDIFFKLFQNPEKIDRAVLMMQEEVANRLIAPVGSKTYGKLTITANYFANIKKEFVVQPSSFVPAPKIKSAVVSFEFKGKENDKAFLDFIKNSFAMRRKTLHNNLKKIMGSEKAKNIIVKMGLKETIRPQELSLEQFIELYNLSK